MVFVHRTSAVKKEISPVFADNDWATIIEACHANEVPETWVADGTCYKDMDIGGTTYRIDIIGKNHDDLADGTGKAPLTFQMHDCYSTKYSMNDTDSGVTGWQDCDMRTVHLPSILLLLPDAVQAGIRSIKKLTGADFNGSSLLTSDEELFLLSEVEVFGSIQYSAQGEGTQYQYYQLGNTAIKNFNSVASFWVERSPRKEGFPAFCNVNNTGTRNADISATFDYGVPFAFCF